MRIRFTWSLFAANDGAYEWQEPMFVENRHRQITRTSRHNSNRVVRSQRLDVFDLCETPARADISQDPIEVEQNCTWRDSCLHSALKALRVCGRHTQNLTFDTGPIAQRNQYQTQPIKVSATKLEPTASVREQINPKDPQCC
jgi:hypothetical protein